ncbi:MAG: Rieske (2Fe-2S) protein [Acidobacteriota bacterium]
MSAERCSRRAFLNCSGGFALGLASLGLSADLLASPRFDLEGRTSGRDVTYPAPAADSVSIDRTNQIILVRADGHIYAFALSCPHQNAAVKWVDKDHRFQCTKHDSRYQPDGAYTSGRATRNLDRFPIRRDGGSVVVDASRVFQSDKDQAGWAAATVPA